MIVFLATLLLMGLAVGAMAIGVAVTKKPLKGSCGGIAGADCFCARQGIDPAECTHPKA